MKKIIRLTESDLIRLVRRVINEQTDNVEPLSNKSEGIVVKGILIKLPQIKSEDILSDFVSLPGDNKEIMKQVFGEDSKYSKNASNSIFTANEQATVQFAVITVVRALLLINALSGQKTPILNIEEAKTLVKQIDFSKNNPGNGKSRWFGNVEYVQDELENQLIEEYENILVYYKIVPYVFNYYSKLLQSKIR